MRVDSHPMKRPLILIAFLLGLILAIAPLGWTALRAHAEPPAVTTLQQAVKAWAEAALSAHSSPDHSAGSDSEDAPDPDAKDFEQLVEGWERLEGLFTLYRDRPTGKLYLEIRRDQLNVNYLNTVTLESGVGEGWLYSGLPLLDMLFNFRQVNNRVQFVVPNLYFRTRPGDPQTAAVRRAFSDSTLQSLPILTTHPTRKSLLIDLGPLLLKDFPGLTPMLALTLGARYSLDADKSSFGMVKVFPLNVELESIYGFSGGTEENGLPAFVETLPDSRSFNLRVRYSFSQLPAHKAYRPRKADDRIGYFLSAYQDFSQDTPRSPFVRLINRWHLEKQDPTAPLSPPKQPIVFWIENTVPLIYRDAVRDGILMWNQAFEAAGFKDAIEARQMPNNATWDPADVRYNTIRWLTSYDNGFLGLGPSRVNPLTGEILDADILIDSSFARYLKQQYQNLVQQNQLRWLPSLAKATGNANLCTYGPMAQELKGLLAKQRPVHPLALQQMSNYDLCYGLEATQQFALGASALTMLHNALPNGPEMNAYVQEFLRAVVAHEVGHTLGLRHNFRASAMLQPEELNDRAITRSKGLIGSVMDYAPVNLAPQGTPQGDYFTQRVGPYDVWAIAYGYTPSDPANDPMAERKLLETIARRAPEPDLGYATDEDIFADLDPLANAFDLSGNLLTYAPWQFENALQMWKKVDSRYPLDGESFSDVRTVFNGIFSYYFNYARMLTTYVGGQSFNRYRGGDAVGRSPFEPISLAQQRQALELIQTYVFDDRKFRFSPGFLNKLAPSRWSHWGADPVVAPLDYPIYDRILGLQSFILEELLSYDRLARLRDAELKASPEQVLTIPELFNTLQTSIWQEILPADSNAKVAQRSEGPLHLSSLRRGLQRQHLAALSSLVLRQTDAPEDARSIAGYSLRQLREHLDRTLRRRDGQMDTYTRAHLEESRDRLIKTLDARLQTQ
jgi:hypothetical protein